MDTAQPQTSDIERRLERAEAELAETRSRLAELEQRLEQKKDRRSGLSAYQVPRAFPAGIPSV